MLPNKALFPNYYDYYYVTLKAYFSPFIDSAIRLYKGFMFPIPVPKILITATVCAYCCYKVFFRERKREKKNHPTP